MRESIAADHPFELQRADARRGARLPGRARPAVQGRDHRRPPGRRRARRDADAADDLLPAGPVHRPVPGPARREHRQDRPVQAARHGRRVLARRREAPDAPARLRHGLGDPGGARRSSCGGARRRRSATTAGSASSSTCSASTTSSPGSAFWHPKGQMIWRTLEGAMRELQARRGYQEVSTPIVVSRTAVAPVGPLGPLQATTCSSSSRRTSCSASSR